MKWEEVCKYLVMGLKVKIFVYDLVEKYWHERTNTFPPNVIYLFCNNLPIANMNDYISIVTQCMAYKTAQQSYWSAISLEAKIEKMLF